MTPIGLEPASADSFPAVKAESTLRSRSTRRVAYLILVLIILTIYSYPALRTASITGSRRLPAVSAPDLGLYLSLSRIERDSSGTDLNPYYRVGVPGNALGFLKFRLGPVLFGLLTNLFGGRLWPALFVWNLFWWGSLCMAAIWLFQRFLPQVSTELVLGGVALLMLFNFGMVTQFLRAWMHFPSLSSFQALELMYIRPFFPQIAVPLLLFYVGLQIFALQKLATQNYAFQRNIIAPWALMVLLQCFAFATFPYTMVMMAGTTAIAVLPFVLSRTKSAWRIVVGYAFVCFLLDLAFLVHKSAGFRSGLPDQKSLVHVQLSLLPLMIGKLWILMGVLVVAIFVSRKLTPEVKWTLVGMGLTNMLFVLADAVVPESTLMLSDHAGYFVHSTVVVLLIFAVSAYAPSRGEGSILLRRILLAGIGFCLLNAALVAEASTRQNLPDNIEQADMARWFERGQVARNDLVIAQYDACAWVPLLSDAESLFCQPAQCLLTPEQNRQLQRFREVLYLYFDGKDRQWLDTTTELERYGFYFELTGKGADHDQRVTAVRSEMRPFFDRVERGDPTIKDFFRRSRRVWIVQQAQSPVFVDSRLSSYLDLQEREKVGELLIMSSVPK
jgi:hypothetical protein